MRTLLLSQGKVAVIDDEDYAVLSQNKWTLHNAGYAYRFTAAPEHKCVLMHRQIMDAPKDMDVDHRNGNKLDNRKSNLRIATRSQNSNNVLRKRPGIEAVSSSLRYRGYLVRYLYNGRRIYVGYAKTIPAAYQLYRKSVFSTVTLEDLKFIRKENLYGRN